MMQDDNSRFSGSTTVLDSNITDPSGISDTSITQYDKTDSSTGVIPPLRTMRRMMPRSTPRTKLQTIPHTPLHKGQS